MRYSAPRGTNDFLPDDTPLWQMVEDRFRSVAMRYGYHEIRTPVFEEVDLFTRSMGEHTDVVSKEMYVFEDRGGRRLALKPEGTAPAVRAYVQHNLAAEAGVNKLYYLTQIFRYERPQAGRYRQAHQVGIEALGSQHPAIDAEVIALAMQFYREIGIDALSLVLNSVGCPACRPIYREKLQQYAKPFVAELCDACQTRYENNPMRMLDCKRPECRERLADAPDILDSLCDECSTHFTRLRGFLNDMGVNYRVDKNLVRGFDYYTKTAFEIQSDSLGSQNALGGGGRYDGLVEEIGGQSTPGIGFALGVERAIIVLKQLGIVTTGKKPVQVFVAALGEQAETPALLLMQQLRNAGISVDMDFQRRSLKAQMKLADKSGASYTVLMGEDELKNNSGLIRNMADKQQQLVSLGECCHILSEALDAQSRR